MQLSCNRHWVSGARRPLPCPKCARLNAKSAALDTPKKSGHFLSTPSPVLVVAPPPSVAKRSGSGQAQPEEQRHPPRAASSVESMKSEDATQLQKRRGCRFCRAAGQGIVWGMETCRECGARLNEVADRMRVAKERGTL